MILYDVVSVERDDHPTFVVRVVGPVLPRIGEQIGVHAGPGGALFWCRVFDVVHCCFVSEGGPRTHPKGGILVYVEILAEDDEEPLVTTREHRAFDRAGEPLEPPPDPNPNEVSWSESLGGSLLVEALHLIDVGVDAWEIWVGGEQVDYHGEDAIGAYAPTLAVAKRYALACTLEVVEMARGEAREMLDDLDRSETDRPKGAPCGG